MESEKWDSDQISKVIGTPWKPYLQSEDDRFLATAPHPALEKIEDAIAQSGANGDDAIRPGSESGVSKPETAGSRMQKTD